MVDRLPHKIRSNFNTDEEFIAYMKKRRIQATNIQWRKNHPKPVTKPYKTSLVEKDDGLKIVDESITILF